MHAVAGKQVTLMFVGNASSKHIIGTFAKALEHARVLNCYCKRATVLVELYCLRHVRPLDHDQRGQFVHRINWI